MSTLQIESLSNSTGTKTVPTADLVDGRCTAWVTFSGTTGAIINSFNVSSVTRTAVGQYIVNFTLPMVNLGYCATVTNELNSNFGAGAGSHRQSSKTTTLYKFGVVSNIDSWWVDSLVSNVQFFGGK